MVFFQLSTHTLLCTPSPFSAAIFNLYRSTRNSLQFTHTGKIPFGAYSSTILPSSGFTIRMSIKNEALYFQNREQVNL